MKRRKQNPTKRRQYRPPLGDIRNTTAGVARLAEIIKESEKRDRAPIDDSAVFTNCNVCGRKLHYADEDTMGMCDGCAAT